MGRKLKLASCGLLLLTIAAAAQASKPKEEHRTVQQLLDRGVSNFEHEFIPACEAMPDDKYDFAPTGWRVQRRAHFSRNRSNTSPP